MSYKPFPKLIYILALLIECAMAQDVCYHIHGVGNQTIAKQINMALRAWQTAHEDTCPEGTTLQHVVATHTQPFGYFQPRLKVGEDQTLYIKLGKQIRYGAINTTIQGPGQHDRKLAKLLKQSLIQVGKPFDSTDYQMALSTLEKAAQQAGYLHASAEQSTLILDPKSNQAKAHIILKTGKVYHFGSTAYQNHALTPTLMQRLLRLDPGTPFTYTKLAQAQERLNKSGYFESVEIHPDFSHPTKQTIPIVLHTTLAKRFYEILGTGYDTDLGWQIKGGLQIKRINAHGHQMKIQTNVATRESNAAIHYILPGQNPPDNYHQLSSYLQHSRTLNAGSTDLIKLAYQSVLKRFGMSLRPGLFVQQERSELNYNQSRYTTRLIYPQIELSGQYNREDLWLHHRFTLNWRLRAMMAKNWPSQNTLSKASERIHLKWYVSEQDRLVLQQRLGWLHTQDLAQTPLSMQWALGGSQDLRGYAYQSIPGTGPPQRHLKYISIEAQHQLSDPWFAVAFFDAGNVTRGLNDPWLRSVGMGLMWSSSLGDLTISLAHPLDDPDTHWRIHLNLTL